MFIPKSIVSALEYKLQSW